jgi:hypothetical protein
MRAENVYALCLLLSLTFWVQVCKRQVYFLLVFLKCSKFTLVAQKQTLDLLPIPGYTFRPCENWAKHSQPKDSRHCLRSPRMCSHDPSDWRGCGPQTIREWLCRHTHLASSWTEIDLRRLWLFLIGSLIFT